MGTLVISGVMGVLVKPPLLADSFAGFTVTAMPDPSDVCGDERMTSGAMAAGSFDSPASPIVFGDSHRFKVVRIDATPVPAQVVNGVTWWDDTLEKLIGYSVCRINYSLDTKLTIAMRDETPSPNPAGGRLPNLSQETLHHGAFQASDPTGFATPPETLIMLEAQTLRNTLPLTAVCRTEHRQPPTWEYNTESTVCQEGSP